MLSLPLTDPSRLKRRFVALAEQRPAVYRMLDANGRVVYVGKARRLRARLLSYFRDDDEDDRNARILGITDRIEWDYQPSEFAALLGELRQIQRYRPALNIRLNRPRRPAFVKVSGGAAPKVFAGRSGPGDIRLYGPLRGARQVSDAVRVLNDMLGLRDCALSMPVVFAEQGDLFHQPAKAACLRYELGTCSGPCAGLVSERDYRAKAEQGIQFLEGRAIAPLDRVVASMMAASDRNEFEAAARWRERFELLEWLLAGLTRVRSAISLLSFVYHDPGALGDDRSYVIVRARVIASAPTPHTPIEKEAFRSLLPRVVADDPPGPLPAEHIDEMLLLLSWFRRHPGAMKRTEPLDGRTGGREDGTVLPSSRLPV